MVASPTPVLKSTDVLGLIDMDNTLFAYEAQIRKDLMALMSPGEKIVEDFHDESTPYIKARMNLIKTQPGWWRNLPKYQPGWDIYKAAKELGFKIQIFTKGPWSRPYAWAEKLECIHNHFGTDVSIDINSEGKAGRYGRFLVDDYPQYASEWLEFRPRGLVIMPIHNYNKDFHHPNVVKYDGTNIYEIVHILTAVKNRKSGQHWKELL